MSALGGSPQDGAPKQKMNWLGVLADALAGAAGKPGPYAAMLGQQQQQQQEEQTYQHHKADALDMWRQQQEYKAAHPDPVNNDTANDYSFWQQHLPPEQFQQYVSNKVNPPRYMEIPGVGLVQVPTTPSAQPQRPVGKLTPLGGPTPPASGTFR